MPVHSLPQATAVCERNRRGRVQTSGLSIRREQSASFVAVRPGAPGLTLFVAVAPSAQYAARALTERRGFATIAPSGPRRLHPMDNLLGGEGRRERGQALGC